LKGKLKETVTGHSYANFQEMCQKAIKIPLVVDENEATEEEEVQAKKKFGLGSSNPFPGRNPKRFNPRKFQNRGKQPKGSRERKPYDKCFRHHSKPCRCAQGKCYGYDEFGNLLANCPKATWNYQGNTQRPNYRPQQSVPLGRPVISNKKERKKPQATS